MLGAYISAFFISMLPVVELRLGVPWAMGFGIDQYAAIVVCCLGNIFPIPFIYIFARRVLHAGAKRPRIGNYCQKMLTKGEKAGEKLVARTGRFGLFMALMLFVAIPLPGTGAWTGTMAASFLKMGVKSTFFSVALGVIIAGCIMGLGTAGVFHLLGI